jgi:hypothetical protein
MDLDNAAPQSLEEELAEIIGQVLLDQSSPKQASEA